MKKRITSVSFVALLLGIVFTSLAKSPATIVPPSPLPAGVGGKWIYGTFSPTNFWGADGRHNGAASEQSMAFSFGPDGTYEMYVINATTYYNCRMAAYTYWKGKAKFDEANQSVTLTPVDGTQRGEYGCYPNKNFKRKASDSERTNAYRTYRYALETDAKGRPALRLFFGDTDKQGAQFKTASW